MKLTLMTMLALFSFLAVAQNKYVCQQYNRKTDRILKKTIVLEQTGKMLPGDYKVPEMQFEASKTPYSMTILDNGLKDWNGDYYKGFAYEEDVNFFFKSNDKKVTFRIYLDEMNESYLKFKSKKETEYFFCN